MHRRRSRKDVSQLEFATLVNFAESASAEIAARRKALRRAENELRNAVKLLEEPWRLNKGFNAAWIKAVEQRIIECDSIREAVVLTASRLSELLDLEIELEGRSQDWRESYDAFCALKLSLYAPPKGHLDEIVCKCWQLGREIFETYYTLSTWSDWGLSEGFLAGHLDEDTKSDFERKQASQLAVCSLTVYYVRLLVMRRPDSE